MNFTELVGGVGFASACLVVLALWVDRQMKQQREDTKQMIEDNRKDMQNTIDVIREDAKEDKKMLMDEITYNREVVVKVVATNDILARDLTIKVDKILEKVGV